MKLDKTCSIDWRKWRILTWKVWATACPSAYLWLVSFIPRLEPTRAAVGGCSQGLKNTGSLTTGKLGDLTRSGTRVELNEMDILRILAVLGRGHEGEGHASCPFTSLTVILLLTHPGVCLAWLASWLLRTRQFWSWLPADFRYKRSIQPLGPP